MSMSEPFAADATDPDRALRALLASLWIMRVQQTAFQMRRNGTVLDMVSALSVVNSADPASPFLTGEDERDLTSRGSWQRWRDRLHAGLVPTEPLAMPLEELSDIDAHGFAAWCSRTVMNTGVALAFLSLYLPEPALEYLQFHLATRSWLPEEADMRAGAAFVQDWMDWHADTQEMDYAAQLERGAADPSLKELPKDS